MTTESLNYNESVRVSILEAAQSLFAKFGYKKTTMEDIALELHKGKSSLYYYFKNKEEIFQAVIDKEQGELISKLKVVVESDKNPQEKLNDYVLTRMKTISEQNNYFKALTDERFGGIEFVKTVKETTEKAEVEMIELIINEGIADGSFHMKNVHMGAMAIALALKGVEIPMFKAANKYEDMVEQVQNILNILFFGLIKR
ncbi:TetR/AcrR family transcriptional regulator [Saccharicrinis fermentans]|uniref:HTH-type transcriptional repressor KstR2 n=1 Tax=Saccharicrinis fermentans DSM 9555 = JCM 21142 TaxID=869213 RepID=W7XZ80_9BACT|nr:TetR/AcrR family transcriptional regulator [Saccharicrinis fermentans]GAF03985.1 HTH-type transcriptional repressor KstR2 [Saccharicrinis fermentans DSM 9555 = JCM 21142]